MDAATPKSKDRKVFFWAALGSFIVGTSFLLQACYADLHHTLIDGGQRRLDPWQGYLREILFLIASAWLLSLALRARKRNDI